MPRWVVGRRGGRRRTGGVRCWWFMCGGVTVLGGSYGVVKDEVKLVDARLLQELVLEKVPRNKRDLAPLTDALLQGVSPLPPLLHLILPRLPDGRLREVQPHDVIPERREQQRVVAATAPGDQRGRAAAVGPGGEEVRAGEEDVAERRGGPRAVPGGDGGVPEVLPGGGVAFGREGGEGCGYGGVAGVAGHGGGALVTRV